MPSLQPPSGSIQLVKLDMSEPTSPSTSSTSPQPKVSNPFLVVLFRGESQHHRDSDPYIESFAKTLPKVTVELIPTLEFVFTSQNLLKDCLSDVGRWSAVCLTSVRAVEAIRNVLDDDGVSKLVDTPLFVIGHQTKQSAINLGWTSFAAEGDNSADLATKIVALHQSKPLEKPVLFPCSRLRGEDLPKMLAANGVKLHEVFAYETVENRRLKECLKFLIDKIEKQLDSIGDNLTLILVLFSPSGVKAVYGLIKPIIDRLAGKLEVRWVAIGQTTAQAIRDMNQSVWCVSQKPNAYSLAECVYKNLLNEYEDSLDGKVKSPLRLRLESWLNKNMKVLMTDGRTLVGIFLCTDRDRNIILGSCLEYLNSNDDNSNEEPRVLGLAMIPGQHVVSIHVDEPLQDAQKTPPDVDSDNRPRSRSS